MCNVQNLGKSVSILDDRFNAEVVDNKISTLQTMDPIFAGMLSAVVPGLGQFVSDNPLVGISYLIPAGVLAGFLSNGAGTPTQTVIVVAAYVALTAGSAVSAYMDCKKKSK